jgi:hypothetical protein
MTLSSSIASLPTKESPWSVNVSSKIAAIASHAVTLWNAGARTLLVPNVLNPALTPAIAARTAPVRGAATQTPWQFSSARKGSIIVTLHAAVRGSVWRLDSRRGVSRFHVQARADEAGFSLQAGCASVGALPSLRRR